MAGYRTAIASTHPFARPRPAPPVLVVLALLAALAGCSGSSSDAADAPTSTTRPDAPVERRDVAIDAPTFWFGDDLGSLFEVRLDQAEVVSGRGRPKLVLTGTAENLLEAPARFEAEGRLGLGGAGSREFDGGTAGEVAPHEQEPVRFTVPGVPADLDPAGATLTFGAPGTNQAIVPLQGDPVGQIAAPRQDFVPEETLTVAPGATLRVTGSIAYPRFVSGREGQQRIQIQVSVEVPEDQAAKGLYLHASLVTPDGLSVSAGDENAFPPGDSFVLSAVVNPPVAGAYTFRVLEVRTQVTADLGFSIAT